MADKPKSITLPSCWEPDLQHHTDLTLAVLKTSTLELPCRLPNSVVLVAILDEAIFKLQISLVEQSERTHSLSLSLSLSQLQET